MKLPIMHSERLVLRGFKIADAKRVQLLAGEFAIADTTLNIPHPYGDGMAEEWIKTHGPNYEEKKGLSLAIALRENHLLIGAISLMKISAVHQNAEMGYWIGKEYWGNGYCTEAARRVLEFGFQELNLHRIYAHHMSRNPASGTVLKNIGMKHEGTVREAILKWKKFEDIEIYGILEKEFKGVA